MEENKPTVDTTTEQPAPAVEEKNETNTSDEQSSDADVSSQQPENIDYKAQLEIEKKKRQQAEYAVEKERARRLQSENKSDVRYEEEQTVSDEDRPLTAAEARRMIEEVSQKTALVFRKSRLQELIQRSTLNADHAALVSYHLQNSIVPTGDDEEDVKRALAIADAPKIRSTISSLQRSLASKANTSTSAPSGGHRLPEKIDEKKYSEKELKLLQKFKAGPFKPKPRA